MKQDFQYRRAAETFIQAHKHNKINVKNGKG